MSEDNKNTNLLTRFIDWLGTKPINERQMLNETSYLLRDRSIQKIHDFLEDDN